MLDREALEPWISGTHLDEDALERSRTTLAEHPAKMLVLHDVYTDAAAKSLATFLRQGAEYQMEHGLYSRHEGVRPDEWEAAPEADRFFRFGKLSGTRADAALDPSTISYLRWRAFVTQPPFHDFFEALTGITVGPSDDFGAHRFEVGDFLKDHDDDNKDRRIAFVSYLSPGWEPGFGGALYMRDPNGDVHQVESTFNTMVVFDVSADTSHHVGAIDERAGERARYTFGGWFPNIS